MKKGTLFLLLQISLTLLGVYLVGREMILTKGEWIPILWLMGFGILFWNVIYLFLMSLFSLFCKPGVLPETEITEYPKTALCYFVRNEDTELLVKRMDWSLGNNQIQNLDFWILSDSDHEFEEAELKMTEIFKEKYGDQIFYRRRKIAFERKQGNLKDFMDQHPEYSFLFVCDADSLVPLNTVSRLLKKALHSRNTDIAIFQTLIRTAHAKTYYAKFDGIASESGQRLYFKTHQAIFGNALSFGHQCLIQRDAFQRVRLPKGLLSHDNWDTALLDRLGYRIVFVPEVETFDEAPANYIEARQRESRWARGTLQGWPLVFFKNLSLGVRFMLFHSIYCYLAQPIFLVWFLLGLFSQSFHFGELLSFKTDTLLRGEFFINSRVSLILVFSLCVIFFHKLVLVKNKLDLKNFFYELFFSTLIFSGNFLYSTLDFLSLPFKKLIWRPMKKDPFDTLDFLKTSKYLSLGTVLGVLGLLYLWKGTPNIQWASLPLLVSMTLSIPAVYLSSKSMKGGS